MINISDDGWVPMARDLMSRKRKFTVPDWDEKRYGKEAKALCKEFNYDRHLDSSGQKAYFFPSN